MADRVRRGCGAVDFVTLPPGRTEPVPPSSKHGAGSVPGYWKRENMRKLIYMVSVLLLLGMASCGKKTKETRFDKFGVSFVCPENWEVTEALDFGGAYYICVEETADNTMGLVTFSVMRKKEDLLSCLDYMGADLREMEECEISGPEDGVYNLFPAKTCEYVVTIREGSALGYMAGRLTVFNAGEGTVCVMEQIDRDDMEKERGSFRLIEETFKISGE